ncbi:MAG TPA: hypothetical protein VEA99_06070 [Gemmatimonadaceae bacterium]|nr:hypothetical protein [Gemmatimonadaceae bacterium]
MLSFHGDGENRHRVEAPGGTSIGWVRGRTVGFRGLSSEHEAIDAAVDASRALGAVLRRAFPGWPDHTPAARSLRLVHDGAHEWISDGRVPIARLLRVRGDASPERSYGLEFVLPSYASEGLALTAAQAIGGALLPRLAFEG